MTLLLNNPFDPQENATSPRLCSPAASQLRGDNGRLTPFTTPRAMRAGLGCRNSADRLRCQVKNYRRTNSLKQGVTKACSGEPPRLTSTIVAPALRSGQAQLRADKVTTWRSGQPVAQNKGSFAEGQDNPSASSTSVESIAEPQPVSQSVLP